jgi:hypothetical protein
LPAAGLAGAWIRAHAGVLWTALGLVAAALLVLAWTAAGIAILRELVRWFAEVAGPMPTRVGGWTVH